MKNEIRLHKRILQRMAEISSKEGAFVDPLDKPTTKAEDDGKTE